MSPVEKSLRVNRPVQYGKWKFYLLSYGNENQAYITVQAKSDAGVPVVAAGVWITIIGAFGQCLGIGQPFKIAAPAAGKKHESENFA